jgi:hypothetical protein
LLQSFKFTTMKKFSLEIKWAVVFMLMTLVWMIAEKAIGLHDAKIEQHAIYTNVIAIPAIIIFVLALRDKRTAFYNGAMTWSQGFVTGIIISFFIALLNPLTQFIVSTYITPDYFNNAIAYVVKSKIMIEKDAVAYFSLKSYIVQGTFGALSMGLITSAIVAYFLRSKK